MAADLLERFVKPVLEDAGLGLRYSDGDDAITFNFRHNGVPMHIGVLDIGVGIPMLAIVVNDIVEFPTEQQMSALKLANNLNLQSPGKIMCLRTIGNCFIDVPEVCVQDTTGTDTFKDMLESAVLTVAREHAGLMRARWREQPVDEAMKIDPPYKDVRDILHEYLDL